jgi:hypothetical protein
MTRTSFFWFEFALALSSSRTGDLFCSARKLDRAGVVRLRMLLLFKSAVDVVVVVVRKQLRLLLRLLKSGRNKSVPIAPVADQAAAAVASVAEIIVVICGSERAVAQVFVGLFSDAHAAAQVL